MHFAFLSVTTVCEFTLQIKNKQTEKCNCAFLAYIRCEMNTNISFPSNSEKLVIENPEYVGGALAGSNASFILTLL